MAKKQKAAPSLRQYEVNDVKMNRTLRMFVPTEDCSFFESCNSFIKKVELAVKIEDFTTNVVIKNKLVGMAA